MLYRYTGIQGKRQPLNIKNLNRTPKLSKDFLKSTIEMSNFLSMLPLEIRMEIYDLILPWIIIEPTYESKSSRGRSRLLLTRPLIANIARRRLALLLVNRQISREAATCFYGKYGFTADSVQMNAFLGAIGSSRRDLITSLDITIKENSGRRTSSETDERNRFRVVSILTHMHDLRTVNINVGSIALEEAKPRLIEAGLLHSTGKFDICVYDTKCVPIGRVTSEYQVKDTWSCEKDDTEWKYNDAPRNNLLHLKAYRLNLWVYE